MSATTRYVTDRAASPVRWQEWGKTAIERARKENRPLFVSIGFAASWDCQRMHREAFLNGENAEALNNYFVPVLLDRIEYPEIAQAYENVLRAMQPGEGWPANLILTPDLEPFAGARFLSTPELSRMLVLQANRWASERKAVVAEGRANIAHAGPAASAASHDALAITRQLRSAENRAEALGALRRVAGSAERDQLGGGFHRCADCYEKLLTDQTLWATSYLEAWQLTRDPDLAFVARTTLDAAIRDLVPPRGLFQSAQDAHSLVPGQGPVFVEGAFYLWNKAEIERLLGHDAAGKVFQLYSLKESGNRLAIDPRHLHETYNELAAPLQRMLTVRQTRPAPFREGSVAASNGLMISALARGYIAFHQPQYLDAATDAATLVSTKLWHAATKTLDRTESRTEALAEDYAFLVQGLLDLFEVTSNVQWLDLAMALQQRQDQLFWDAGAGRYGTGKSVPAVVRSWFTENDRQGPRVNSVAALNLLRLVTLTGNEAWRTRLARYELPPTTPKIVIVTGRTGSDETQQLLQSTRDRWEPLRTVLLVPDRGTQRQRLVNALPFLGALTPDPEHPVVYECTGGQCRKQ